MRWLPFIFVFGSAGNFLVDRPALLNGLNLWKRWLDSVHWRSVAEHVESDPLGLSPNGEMSAEVAPIKYFSIKVFCIERDDVANNELSAAAISIGRPHRPKHMMSESVPHHARNLISGDYFWVRVISRIRMASLECLPNL